MSKVYRMIVETDAKHVFCPITSSNIENYCRGSECAAWFWVNAPELTKIHFISLEMAHRDGLLERNGIKGPLPAVLNNLEAFNEVYEKFSQIEVKVSDFLPPAGTGWEPSEEPYYDSDEGRWFLTFIRAKDTIAAGYCGMVGQRTNNNGE